MCSRILSSRSGGTGHERGGIFKKGLLPLGIYPLRETGAVWRELCAYAAALDTVNEMLDEILQESVVKTAESFGLEMLELITGAPRTELSLKQRREMLIARLSLTYGDFTLSGTQRALSALGLKAQILNTRARWHCILSAAGHTRRRRKMDCRAGAGPAACASGLNHGFPHA